MKFTCQRNPLVSAIQAAVEVAIRTHSMPILTCVRIVAEGDRVEVVATDLERSVRRIVTDAVVETPGSRCIDGTLLKDLAANLPDDLVRVEADGPMVSVTVRKAKFKLCSLEGDEYPVIPEPTHETPCVTVDAALFGQTLKTAWVACADQEETRAALQSVLISIGEGALTVVSTDGRRLCKVEREVDQTATPVLLLVPKKSADTIVKMFPKGSVHLYWDALMLHVRDSIQTFSARLLEGKFPAYRNLIPKTHEHSVDVDRDILMAAIKRVIVVTDKPDKDKSPQKLIRAELAGGELTLSTRGAQKGLATDSVPIDWNGSLVTAYNGRFLSEGLGTFKSPRVTMGFNGPISAMILTGKDDPGVMYLLMPVRVDPEQDASWAAGVPA